MRPSTTTIFPQTFLLVACGFSQVSETLAWSKSGVRL